MVESGWYILGLGYQLLLLVFQLRDWLLEVHGLGVEEALQPVIELESFYQDQGAHEVVDALSVLRVEEPFHKELQFGDGAEYFFGLGCHAKCIIMMS